jgi:hypothetical protein
MMREEEGFSRAALIEVNGSHHHHWLPLLWKVEEGAATQGVFEEQARHPGLPWADLESGLVVR